jgi:hypothetical protein
VLSLYIKIEKLLKSILNKIGLFATINASLVIAIQKGYSKFEKYYDKMKENDIYWITYMLNPRIKTKWL